MYPLDSYTLTPSVIHSSTAFHKQDAKEEALANWRLGNINDPIGSKLSQLQIPVTTTPSEFFLSVDMGIYGRIVQAATSHGYLSTYYERFSIDTPIFCSCTDDIVQTHYCILFICLQAQGG